MNRKFIAKCLSLLMLFSTSSSLISVQAMHAKHDVRIHQEISEEFNNSLLGNELTCIVDEITEDGEYYICRSYMDVPDIDGLVFVENTKIHNLGDFIKVKVQSITEYDLIAKEI